MGKYEPFGPFAFPYEGKKILRSSRKTFWAVIEEQSRKGLPDAVGCYILAVKKSGTISPWYVGKTERKNFSFECCTDRNLTLWREALDSSGSGSTPQLYLLAKMTKTGRFRKSALKAVSDADFLEGALIGRCVSLNPKLINKSKTKHQIGVHLPGFMNATAVENKSETAIALAELLGTK